MKIRTRDKDLYLKLKSLNYTDEIVVSSKNKSLNKIMKTLNRKGDFVKAEKIGEKTLLRRLRPLNINIQHIRRQKK